MLPSNDLAARCRPTSAFVPQQTRLTDNAVNGIGAMPPKGGAAELSREQIHAAILYLAAPQK